MEGRSAKLDSSARLKKSTSGMSILMSGLEHLQHNGSGQIAGG
jgi:hypothetical protein